MASGESTRKPRESRGDTRQAGRAKPTPRRRPGRSGPAGGSGAQAALRSAYRRLERENARRRQAQAELARVNRMLQMLGDCNQALIKAADENRLLRDICRLIVQVGGYRMAWVGLAEHDKDKTVRPLAYRGFVRGYLRKSRISWANDRYGRGPTGRAIRTGRPCIARNIPSDPRFAPWRAEAVRRGYRSSIAIPLVAEKVTFGALSIYASEPDAFNAREVKLLRELADDLAYGLDALRTRTEREQADAALKRLNRRLMDAREQEQRRLARELHDWLGQELLGLKLAVHNALADHADALPPEAVESLRRAEERSQELTREVRNICYGLYPIALEAMGLGEALAQLARDCRSDIPVRLRRTRSARGARFAPDVEIALFRIAQEAVNNAVKYSQASWIEMRLAVRDSQVRLEVADNGVGFDAEMARHGLGLTTMKERADAVGGRLAISSAPGRTRIVAGVPVSNAK